MGWKPDIKSAVAGGVIVAVAALFLGAAKSEPTLGRYQIQVAAGSSLSAGVLVYIVDTMTGRVWTTSAVRSQDDHEFYGPKIEGSN